MRGSDTKKTKDTAKKRGIWLPLTLFLSLLFILLSMIGLFGTTLKGFFLGVFGFSGYALVSLAIILYILALLGVLRGKMKGRTIAYIVVCSFILLLFLQVITGEFKKLSYDSLSSYLDACYAAGAGTSGGWLFGLIAYPLLSFIGKYSAILYAVLFFVVLFFAFLPFMRGEKGASSVADRPDARQADVIPNDGRELFVDSVRPGQRDAQKIRMKGLFGGNGAEPRFFDYNDERPLTLSEGVIPEPQAAQFDVYGGRTETFEDDSYEEYPYVAPRGADRRPTLPDSYEDDDMPAFVKRLAGDRARANRTLYGDTTFDSIPDEPRFNTRTQDAPSDVPVAPQPAEPTRPAPVAPVSTRPARPAPVAPKPKVRTDGIIEKMSDLERLRDREGTRPTSRTTFIGENVVPVQPALNESVVDPVAEETHEPEPTYTQTFIAPEQTEAPTAPAESKPLGSRTITPSDASTMEPVEEPYVPDHQTARVIEPAPIRPLERQVAPQEDAPVEANKPTRKPRSDIGGTHRTQDNGYIDPKKLTQMNIEQVEQEEEVEPPVRPYTAPSVSLLDEYPPMGNDEDVEQKGEMLVSALRSFHIETEIVDHKTGPTFTQFAVRLPDNMSVNKLTPLEKDIKRKLMVEKNIRIIPSVPGLDAVGIELPNDKTSTVGLRSIISSPVFEKEGKLNFAIGVDVSGKAVYGNLLKMPHLLVAGSTGSGKSVAINVMITSIMYHYSPEFVRFIMVDPKKVELARYREMPHMLLPNPVNDADKAVNALTWAVNEMERRYQLLMENGCLDLGEYNAMQKKRGEKGLYYIVFIIDEMADLMSVAKREVEDRIGRLTAKARAAGIHLVIATQRPSVDVITGVIKNNIPTRIAFKVTSFTDSKTILDRGGAESLFGNGDMLYVPPDGGDPIRLQGPFISNPELKTIVSFIKENNDARYDKDADRLIQAPKEAPPEPKDQQETDDDGEDPLFAESLLYLINSGEASISKLQIKFRIGYGRAKRLVETMAERGYLGPAEGGNKSRQVIITLDEYYQLYGNGDDDGEGGQEG